MHKHTLLKPPQHQIHTHAHTEAAPCTGKSWIENQQQRTGNQGDPAQLLRPSVSLSVKWGQQSPPCWPLGLLGGRRSWSPQRSLLEGIDRNTGGVRGFPGRAPEEWRSRAPTSPLSLSEGRLSPPHQRLRETEGRRTFSPRTPAGLARVKWQLPGGAELNSLV